MTIGTGIFLAGLWIATGVSTKDLTNFGTYLAVGTSLLLTICTLLYQG